MTPEQENKLLKEFLYCTKRSCNNCGKVNCENFQRQRIDCCGLWVSYKDYIKELEKENAELKADNDARKFAMGMSEKVEKQLREENAGLKARLNAINLLTPELEKLSKLKTQQLTKVKYTLKKIIETVHNDRIDEYGARLVLINDFANDVLQEIEK